MAVSGEVLFSRGTGMSSDHSDIWDDTALIDAYDKGMSEVYKKIASRRKAADSASEDLSESCSDAKHSEIEETCTSESKKHFQTNSKHKKPKWKIGDYCRAVYDDDGMIYDCKITHLDTKNNRSIVEFVGYGNTQSVPVTKLIVSKLKHSTLKQIETTENDVEESEGHGSEDPRRKRHHSKRSKSKGSSKQTCHSPSRSFLPPLFMGMPPNMSSIKPMIPPMDVPPPPSFFNGGDSGEEDEALAAMLMSWYMSGFHTGYYQALKQLRNKPRT